MRQPNGNSNGFEWCTYCGDLDHTDKTCPLLDRYIKENWNKIQKVLTSPDNFRPTIKGIHR